MTFKPSEGEYWYARLLNGKWGVFWTHPNYEGWHRLVAEFPNEARAESYVEVSNMCLGDQESEGTWEEVEAPPKLLPPPSHDVKINRMVEPMAQKLIADLPELFEQFPDGITSGIVRDRYGVNYNDACEALRYVDTCGLGKWLYQDGQGGGKRLFPPNADVEERELTYRQEAVLLALQKMADEHGCVSSAHKDIAAAAMVSTGGLTTHLWALERKKFIMTAKPATHNGATTAVFQILRSVDNSQHLLSILEKAGVPMTNAQIAAAMGVSDGEATRRRQEVEDQIEVTRDGKFKLVSLRPTLKDEDRSTKHM